MKVDDLPEFAPLAMTGQWRKTQDSENETLTRQLQQLTYCNMIVENFMRFVAESMTRVFQLAQTNQFQLEYIEY